jgi:hypothetical protein
MLDRDLIQKQHTQDIKLVYGGAAMPLRLAHDSAPDDLGGKVKLETPTLPLESWIVDDL